MEPLLKPGERIVVAANEPFAVSSSFAPDMNPDARILISMVGANFVKWFGEKNVLAFEGSPFEWLELQANASNTTILEAAGGPAAVETSLGVACSLMRKQPRGEAGPLAVNGWGNIFYVKDVSGQLRAVYIHWCEDSWNIDANQIEAAAHWPIRDRVFRPIR